MNVILPDGLALTEKEFIEIINSPEMRQAVRDEINAEILAKMPIKNETAPI